MLALVLVGTVHAQDARLSGGVTVPVGGELGPGWAAEPGLSGQILLPMYGGETRLSLDFSEHAPPDPDTPEFHALVATLGWGPVVKVGPVRLGAGAEVGAGRYAFDDEDEFGAELSSESEVVAGAYVRASMPVAGPVEVWTEAGVRRTFFSTIATTGSVGGGLAVRL